MSVSRLTSAATTPEAVTGDPTRAIRCRRRQIYERCVADGASYAANATLELSLTVFIAIVDRLKCRPNVMGSLDRNDLCQPELRKGQRLARRFPLLCFT